jgi:DNA-binding response OmpR family regulator
MSGPPTIIIAEHDPLIRNVLRVEFSHIGFVVLLAANGPEAEDFAVRTVAHLAVLDIALPGFSGYDACARIRRQAGYERTPIVLSAHTQTPRVAAAATKAGATVMLLKPYSFNDLLNTLSPFLPADDPLLVRLPKAAGLGETAGREWGRPATLEWRFGNGSGLSQNRLMLPIVRGQGIKVPLVRKPVRKP